MHDWGQRSRTISRWARRRESESEAGTTADGAAVYGDLLGLSPRLRQAEDRAGLRSRFEPCQSRRLAQASGRLLLSYTCRPGGAAGSGVRRHCRRWPGRVRTPRQFPGGDPAAGVDPPGRRSGDGSHGAGPAQRGRRVDRDQPRGLPPEPILSEVRRGRYRSIPGSAGVGTSSASSPNRCGRQASARAAALPR
jgi:hypothetical protein